jgi:hypothetical protein
VEGDAGAPVTLDEIAAIEDSLDTVWADLSASAQSVIDRQGVVYADRDGDMVTSIVRGKDCVFTCYEGDNCLCALERAYRQGKTRFCKPISCSLYPIREKNFGNGLIGLNYHRWEVCRDAVIKGKALGLPVYQFSRNLRQSVLYHIVSLLQLFLLTLLQRSSGIAFHTADAFALGQVAKKHFLENIETHNLVIYLYHLPFYLSCSFL